MGIQESLLIKVARRWIAGVNLDSAIADALVANERGMGAIVNYLGEEIRDSPTADAQVQEYLRLEDAIASNSVRGFASVKLTQLGLGADDTGAVSRLETIASKADGLNQSLFVDMEGSPFTEKTVAIYLESLAKHRGLGLALQAYLRRSKADLKVLLDRGAKIRLVKGAYRESSDIVYPTRKDVAENYSALMVMLFERGNDFAIATHDSALIEQARRLADSKHVEFRFEMLKGIRSELKSELVNSGYKVSEYLPYGERWLAYSKRRMTEHPSNLWLLLRSLV